MKIKKNKWIVLILFGMFLIPINLYLVPNASATWWDSDWNYYKTVNVADKIEGYQMKIQIDYNIDFGGDVNCVLKCNQNFSDIRFVYDNTTELPYWIEETISGDYSIMWVNNSGNYSSFEMFYGNADVGNVSNGSATFEFFDDFLGSSIDTNKWEGDTAYVVSVSNSIMEFRGDTAWRKLQTKTKWTGDVAFRQKLLYQGRYYVSGSHQGGTSVTFRNKDDATDYTDMLYFGTLNRIRCNDNAGHTFQASNIDTTERIWELKWLTATSCSFWKDGVAMTGSPLTTNVPDGNPVLPVLYDSIDQDNNDNCGVEVDWVFVRKFVDTEPSWSSFGSEHVYVPPPPDVTLPVQGQDATGNLTITWNVTIEDNSGFFDYTIECNGQSAYGNDVSNGSKSIVLNDLSATVTYIVYVNVTDDSDNWGNATYTFKIIQGGSSIGIVLLTFGLIIGVIIKKGYKGK